MEEGGIKIADDYRIRPCDEEKPYIFISYSSADRDIVYRDVERLQNEGYNIWIDRENLQAGKTWNEKAMEAISRLSCKILVFYLSRNSLRSEPCLEELRQTRDEVTRRRHRGSALDFVPVDVEPINDIVAFAEEVYDLIEEDETKKLSDKERETETVSLIMHEFFQNNNAIDRILAKDHPRRRKGYYEEIMQGLPERTCNRKSLSGKAGETTYLDKKQENEELLQDGAELKSQTDPDSSIAAEKKTDAEAERLRIEMEYARKVEEERKKLEEETARRLEEERKRLEDEMTRKLEEERIRLEEEHKRSAEEIKKAERRKQDEEMARKAAKEYAARKAKERVPQPGEDDFWVYNRMVHEKNEKEEKKRRLEQMAREKDMEEARKQGKTLPDENEDFWAYRKRKKR